MELLSIEVVKGKEHMGCDFRHVKFVITFIQVKMLSNIVVYI